MHWHPTAAACTVSIKSHDQAASCPEDFTVTSDALVNEPAPTLLLCPDAVRLASPDDYRAVLRHLLAPL